MNNYKIKIIVIGDTNVGKSSLIERYYKNLKKDYSPTKTYMTIGIDFRIIKDCYNYKNYLLEIWDSAGQEKYRSICKTFYKNKNFTIIVIDISSFFEKDKFLLNKFINYTKYWIEENNNNITNINSSKLIIVINKIDKIDQDILHLYEDTIINNINELIKDYSNILKFYFSSVRTNFNVNEIFFELVQYYEENYNTMYRLSTDSLSTIDLDSNKSFNVSNKKCCNI